jgi:hypothetical protein
VRSDQTSLAWPGGPTARVLRPSDRLVPQRTLPSQWAEDAGDLKLRAIETTDLDFRMEKLKREVELQVATFRDKTRELVMWDLPRGDRTLLLKRLYSAACFKMGISVSPSFQSVRKP